VRSARQESGLMAEPETITENDNESESAEKDIED
jgi:hypothetical protein